MFLLSTSTKGGTLSPTDTHHTRLLLSLLVHASLSKKQIKIVENCCHSLCTIRECRDEAIKCILYCSHRPQETIFKVLAEQSSTAFHSSKVQAEALLSLLGVVSNINCEFIEKKIRKQIREKAKKGELEMGLIEEASSDQFDYMEKTNFDEILDRSILEAQDKAICCGFLSTFQPFLSKIVLSNSHLSIQAMLTMGAFMLHSPTLAKTELPFLEKIVFGPDNKEKNHERLDLGSAFLSSALFVWAEIVSRHALKQRKDICDLAQGLVKKSISNEDIQLFPSLFKVIAKLIWQKHLTPSAVHIIFPLMEHNREVRAFISQLFEREKASLPTIIFEMFFCGVDPLQRLSIANELCKFKEVTQQGGKIAILCANQIQTGKAKTYHLKSIRLLIYLPSCREK
jgi:hypothetical protein